MEWNFLWISVLWSKFFGEAFEYRLTCLFCDLAVPMFRHYFNQTTSVCWAATRVVVKWGKGLLRLVRYSYPIVLPIPKDKRWKRQEEAKANCLRNHSTTVGKHVRNKTAQITDSTRNRIKPTTPAVFPSNFIWHETAAKELDLYKLRKVLYIDMPSCPAANVKIMM